MSGFVTRWLRHLLHPARAVLLATLTSLAAQAQGTGSHVGQAALDAVSSDLGKTAFLVRNWGPNESQAMRILPWFNQIGAPLGTTRWFRPAPRAGGERAPCDSSARPSAT